MLIQLETQYAKPKPRSVFYSYSHKDEELRNELDTHLKLLKQDGFISTWHDRKIKPGDEWDHVINDNLNTADVILFLVSHNFLASQYCKDVEVKRAMERSNNQEAILIPIIIKPCVWTSQEFAKLQVLPKNCKPLAEWPDSGFAQVAEELRVMLVDMLYPQKPTEATGGQHGNWIMKLRSQPDLDSKERGHQVVKRLREYTEDYTINLQATASTQIMDGEKTQVGLMLILNGSPEAFSVLEKAQRDGILTTEIDKDLLSLYIIHGATVQGSSDIGTSFDIEEVEGKDLLIRPGKKFQPPHLKGLKVSKEEGKFEFVINKGDVRLSENEQSANYQELIDYFNTSLSVKDDFQWVNLSAYEANRMLPKELSGTTMGRNLLAQDCMLKQLTASFMHPDSPIGREYWDAVYAKAQLLYGTSKLPFRSFQKVWITPIKAEVYEKDGDLTTEPGFFHAPGCNIVYVLEHVLGVKCEQDLVAASYNQDSKQAQVELHPVSTDFSKTEDFTLDIFREIVLPKIQEEVNEGEHFAELRRIYSAMVLASWMKLSKPTNNKQIIGYIDSQKPESLKFEISNISSASELNMQSELKKESDLDAQKYDHATPLDPAFEVPENVEFFAKYVRLFKNGLFRCARNEVGDSPDDRIIRVYFSGAIDFRNLSSIISTLKK